ncbi:MAG: hypothetical protein JWP29_3224 [Rhodoferax sp.]|nr:hypothetical protein [Rhodoferax sp.]
MQLPPLDRTVNWPPAGADTPASGANAVTAPRASRVETTAIQTAVSQPEPSVKIEISSAFDEIMKQEKAALAKAAANPLADAAPTGAAKPVDAEGAKDALAVDAAGKTGAAAKESPTDAARKVDTGKLPGPEQPSTEADTPDKDWTTKVKAAEDKPPEPPKEPISKKLLDFLQNLWRAGGQAIDVVDEANKTLNPVKASDSPLTYSDPSVKKTSGA